MIPPNGLSTQLHALVITRDEALRKDLEEKLAGIDKVDSVEVVQNCMAGLEFVRAHLPELIIFDTEVSVLEVLNALRAVKTLENNILCIVIADHVGYHALLSMVGADKILYKGFSQIELATCLN